jgi:hypothetical protein
MYIKRKDGGCEAKVLARVNGRVLIEARWPKNNRNIVFVREDYFAANYA